MNDGPRLAVELGFGTDGIYGLVRIAGAPPRSFASALELLSIIEDVRATSSTDVHEYEGCGDDDRAA